MPPIFDKSKAAGLVFCTLAIFLANGPAEAKSKQVEQHRQCIDPSDCRESESIYLDSDLANLLEVEHESYLETEGFHDISSELDVTASPRVQKLHDYLERTLANGSISLKSKYLAWNVWQMLSESSAGALPVPNAGPGPDGELFYEWDKNEHHLTLEILPAGEREFFYRNSSTGEIWSADFSDDEAVDYEQIKDKLSLFN